MAEASERTNRLMHLAGVALWSGVMLCVFAGWLDAYEELGVQGFWLRWLGLGLAVLAVPIGFLAGSKSSVLTWGFTAALGLAGLAWILSTQNELRLISQGLLLVSCLTLLAGAVGWLRTTREEVAFTPAVAQWQPRVVVGLGIIGLVLLGVAGYYGWRLRLAGLGESLGIGLLALALLLVAWTARDAFDAERTLRTVHRRSRVLALGLLILAAACGAGAAYLYWGGQPDSTPPLLEIALLFAWCLIAVITASVLFAGPSLSSLRTILPLQAGLFGLVTIAVALVRLDLERGGATVGAGLEAWRGERAWVFWLGAYAIFLGLALPMLTLLLCQGEAVGNPGLRGAMFRLQAFVSVACAVLLFVVANVAVYSFLPQNYSWTSEAGLYTLSDAAKALLRSLKEPTTVIAILPSEGESDALSQSFRSHSAAVLDNLQAETKMVSTKTIDPENSKETRGLLERYPILRNQFNGGWLLIYGYDNPDEKTPPKHAFIPRERLLLRRTEEATRSDTLAFRGEMEFIREMKILTQESAKRTIYFVQGGGALDLERGKQRAREFLGEPLTPLGSSQLAKRLGQDKFEIKSLHWGDKIESEGGRAFNVRDPDSPKFKDVPKDCDLLVVLGAVDPWPAEALDVVDRYLQNGGVLLATFDIVLDPVRREVSTSGLEKILEPYGVSVSTKAVVNVIPGPRGDELGPMVLAKVPDQAQTSLARAQSGGFFQIDQSACVVTPKPAGNFQAETLFDVRNVRGSNFLQTPRAVRLSPGNVQYDKEKVPFSIGVAVWEKKKDDEKPRPRLVVLGDTELFSDGFMDPRSPETSDKNYNLFAGAVDWLADREDLAGALPRNSNFYFIAPTTPLAPMVLLPLGLMLLALGGLALGLWFIRRR